MKNILTKTLFVSIIAVLVILTTVQASDDNSSKEFVIIVHKSNSLTSISEKELANIFLGKMTLWESGKRIKVGMLSTDEPQVKSFLKQVCHKSVKRFNAHWMKVIFSGSGIRPKTFTSSVNAAHFVGRNKNSIVVADKAKIKGNIKFLKVITLK